MNKKKKIYLITGCGGFIGMHLGIKLLKNNSNIVIGIDNLNQYYDTKIKLKRVKILKTYNNFKFYFGDLKNYSFIKKIFKNHADINYIFHFAGQAGVRYSLVNPQSYINDNILSFINLLEQFKNSKKIKSIFYASSSSVYGDQSKGSKSNISKDAPISVYAVSKLTMEYLSRVYFKNFKLKSVGLRFFTVYGAYGRPDMAYYKFFKNIINNKKIEVFNKGKHKRSFTYIDDVIDNIVKIKNNLNKINFNQNPCFNIGNPKSISLMKFINLIEQITKKQFKMKFTKKQKGDVINTAANIKFEKRLFKFSFKTNLKKGLLKFYQWFLDYEKK